MHPQLQQVIDEFERAQQRLHTLVELIPDDLWAVRPLDGRWSIAENIEHLNRTSQIFLPVIREKLQEARDRDGTAPARYRRDLLGWFLWKVMPPPVRVMRIKTTPNFVPRDGGDKATLVAHFGQLQRELIASVEAADGLPIDQIMMISPVDDKAKYNLYSCFRILPAHEDRHIWQSERVLEELQRRGVPAA